MTRFEIVVDEMAEDELLVIGSVDSVAMKSGIGDYPPPTNDAEEVAKVPLDRSQTKFFLQSFSTDVLSVP